MNRSLMMLGLLVILAGCPKKDDAAVDAGKTATATSASAAPSATTADNTTTDTTTTGDTTTQAANAPPSGAPEVVDDPNTPPSHDDHDKAATASIQKANYKSELDKLEKEDLNSTK